MKVYKILFTITIAAATVSCSSDSVDGDGNFFRKNAFEENVDGKRLVFVQTDNNADEALFTWDRINQNYVNNDITSTLKYSGDITVPATIMHNGKNYKVTGVDEYAFFYCTKLTGITVEEGLKYWGDNQLVRSTNITKLLLPSTIENMEKIPYAYCAKFGKLKTVQLPPVKEICDSAFCSCISLTNITIPEGCLRIGKYALASTSKLTELTLPSSLIEIGENCFSGCNKLIKIHVKATTPPLMKSDFPNAENATLYVPQGCADAYALDEQWGQFNNIIEE